MAKVLLDHRSQRGCCFILPGVNEFLFQRLELFLRLGDVLRLDDALNLARLAGQGVGTDEDAEPVLAR